MIWIGLRWLPKLSGDQSPCPQTRLCLKNPTTTSPLMRIVLHSSKWARNMWLVTKRRRGGGCRTEGFRVTGTTYSVTQLDRIEKNRQKLSKIWEIDRSYSCLQQFDKFWIWIACNGNYVNLLKNICKSIQHCSKKNGVLQLLVWKCKTLVRV